jgi:3D (Asp-Asp-Asp) domain-containing protein
MIATVTAYCPCEECCGESSDGITASGVEAVGKLCAAPKSIPFGTVIDIPGYGVVTVEDRGSAITEAKLDVLFPTHEAARAWGVQTLEVEIVR